ncbi:MAG: hypothetical protein KDJ80_06040 [Nitratireductor sp.]|nr:hypothetical protein [Nitratireductor sp.]
MRSEQPFSQRLTGYLQNVDYRAAFEPAEREALFRLRYRCYRREETIKANLEERFSDAYDEMDNCWLFGIYLDDQLVSSIRFHVISPSAKRGPAYDVFPDIIPRMIDNGLTVIDPTRLVVERRMTELYPELPYVTIRAAFMAAEYYEAEYMLATVRREHQAFYMRYFGFEKLCDPRPYPSLLKPISLLAANMPEKRDQVVDRFPIFHSSFTERRMLFESSPLHRFLRQDDHERRFEDKTRRVSA